MSVDPPLPPIPKPPPPPEPAEPLKGLCGGCGNTLPEENMLVFDGALYCGPCYERARYEKRRAEVAARLEADGLAPRVTIDEESPDSDELGKPDLSPEEEAALRNELSHVQREFQRYPDHLPNMVKLCETLLALGEYEQVRVLLVEIKKKDPQHPLLAQMRAVERATLSGREDIPDEEELDVERAPPIPDTGDPAVPFWQDLGTVLGYPFEGVALGVLIVGGLGLAIGGAVHNLWLPGVGIPLEILAQIGIWTYATRMIRGVAGGFRTPPDLFEKGKAGKTFFRPLAAVCLLGVVIWGPYRLMDLAPGNPVAGVMQGIFMLVAVAAGPVAILVYSCVGGPLKSIDPLTIGATIRRMSTDYIIQFIFITGIVSALQSARVSMSIGERAVADTGGSLLASVGSPVLYAFLYAYLSLVAAGIIGRTYRHSKDRLDWFRPSEEEPPPPSIPAALGAFVAAALVIALTAAAHVILHPRDEAPGRTGRRPPLAAPAEPGVEGPRTPYPA